MQISEYDLIEMEKRARQLISMAIRVVGVPPEAETVGKDVLTLVARIRSLKAQLDAANLG